MNLLDVDKKKKKTAYYYCSCLHSLSHVVQWEPETVNKPTLIIYLDESLFIHVWEWSMLIK